MTRGVPKRKVAGATPSAVTKSLELENAMRAALVKKMAREDGSNPLLSSEEFFDQVYGIPLEGNLPLQYLLGVDVLALSRVITIVGPSQSTKSSLGWYLLQLIGLYDGLLFPIETEEKTNPDQVLALLGNTKFLELAKHLANIDTTALMNQALNAVFEAYTSVYTEKQRPVGILIDSLNAVTTEEIQAKVKEGKPMDYAGARRAMDIQSLLQVLVPQYIAPNPVSLIMINHQTLSLNQEGSGGGGPGGYRPEMREPGGNYKEFAYTYKLEMTERKGSRKYYGGGGVYRLVHINMGKSSLGSKRPGIVVPYRSEWESTDEGPIEYIWYDWDEALVTLLDPLTDNKLISKTAVKDLLGLTGKGAKYSSSVLGLRDVTKTELGAAIHSDAKLVEALQRDVLRIRIKRKFGSRRLDVQIRHPATLPAELGVAAGNEEAEQAGESGQGSVPAAGVPDAGVSADGGGGTLQ